MLQHCNSDAFHTYEQVIILASKILQQDRQLWRAFLHETPMTVLLENMANSTAPDVFSSLLYDIYRGNWMESVIQQYCTHQDMRIDSHVLKLMLALLKKYVRAQHKSQLQ